MANGQTHGPNCDTAQLYIGSAVRSAATPAQRNCYTTVLPIDRQTSPGRSVRSREGTKRYGCLRGARKGNTARVRLIWHNPPVHMSLQVCNVNDGSLQITSPSYFLPRPNAHGDLADGRRQSISHAKCSAPAGSRNTELQPVGKLR